MASDTWNLVPRTIALLIERLSRRASTYEDEEGPSDAFLKPELYPVQYVLERIVRSGQRAIDASSDLRALATVYAHKFHERPLNFSAIAVAQGVSPAGLRRRYSAAAEEAVGALLASQPDIDLVCTAFPTVRLTDLWGLTAEIDAELQKRSVRRPGIRGEASAAVSTLPFYSDVQGEFRTTESPEEDEVRDAIVASRRLPATLLGLVMSSVRNELESAEWIDTWVSSPHQASLEWKGGIQIDQFLTLVLPVYEGAQWSRGVPGLRLNTHGHQTAVLRWHAGADDIDLRVLRQPQGRPR